EDLRDCRRRAVALGRQRLIVRQGLGEGGGDGAVVRVLLLRGERPLRRGVRGEHRRRQRRQLVLAVLAAAQQMAHRGSRLGGRQPAEQEALQGLAAWLIFAHPDLLKNKYDISAAGV